jgi:hypothetical protein
MSPQGGRPLTIGSPSEDALFDYDKASIRMDATLKEDVDLLANYPSQNPEGEQNNETA